METLKKLLVIILFLVTSCATQKDAITNQQFSEIINKENNINNYREYKEQEIKYYQYVLKNNGEKFEKIKYNSIDDVSPKKSEEIKEKSTSEVINYKKELIQTLEDKGLKPCKFVEKVLNKNICSDSISKPIETKDDPVEESKPKKGLLKDKDKDKEYRNWFWQGVFKIISLIYFTFLAITNFQLFTMVFPTSICLLACICYPIWWKRGYLDTPYAKIATFIAAYGGLFANILWIILYI
jgi:hypothetical protein